MKKQPRIDAVQLMRDLREEVDNEVRGMSYEEQRDYIREQLEKTKSAGATKKIS